MTHITLIIAKTLLSEKKAEVLSTIKPRPKTMQANEHAKIYEAAFKEVKAIDDELWLLNNW